MISIDQTNSASTELDHDAHRCRIFIQGFTMLRASIQSTSASAASGIEAPPIVHRPVTPLPPQTIRSRFNETAPMSSRRDLDALQTRFTVTRADWLHGDTRANPCLGPVFEEVDEAPPAIYNHF